MPSSDSAPEDVLPSSDDLKENGAGGGGDGVVEDQLPLTPDGREEDMDPRTWTWRSSKSLDASPGETESSGSASCSSEKNSVDQDQEGSKTSPNHIDTPESPSMSNKDDNDAIKCLTEKLSAALSTIRNNEELVNQHAKVAEEAVSGWEKAEIEVVHLKQQLDTTSQKNVSLEDRITQLDEALKECVRELRQAKEEQEKKVHDAVLKKSQEWETEKFELESQIVELESQLQAERDASTSLSYNLKSKLEAEEQENSGLRIELFTLSEKFRILDRESELSTQAAESASKQHLDSIKKVAKLEAENRRLRVMSRKPHNDHKAFGNNIYVESITDSQSDSGERMLSVDNDPSCSDSWASALIAELDQFKNEKTNVRDIASSIEVVDLMDDFLEMERFASLPATTARSPSTDLQPSPDQNGAENNFLQAEVEHLHHRIADLEEKVEKVENEKAELAVLLSVTQEKLEISSSELREAEIKRVELQKQVDASRASKQVSDIAVEAADAERAVLQSQLGTANAEVQRLRDQMPVLQSQLEIATEEVQQLHDQVPVLESQLGTANAEVRQLQDQVLGLQSQLTTANARVQHLQGQVRALEGDVEKERILANEFSVKCERLETEFLKKHRAEVHQASRSNGEFKIKQEKELALAAGKLAECQQTIASLGRQLKSLASIEDLMLEGECIDNGTSSSISAIREPTRFAPYNSREAISSLSPGRDRGSVASSTSSSGFPVPFYSSNNSST